MSNKVVLKADNLHKHYPVSQGLGKPKAHVKALNGISLSLRLARHWQSLVNLAAANLPLPAS